MQSHASHLLDSRSKHEAHLGALIPAFSSRTDVLANRFQNHPVRASMTEVHPRALHTLLVSVFQLLIVVGRKVVAVMRAPSVIPIITS